jgi:hypothetical protein
MRINASALGFAAAVVMGVAFGICGLLFATLPGPTAAFASWVLHVDVTQITRPVSLWNLFCGIILFAAYVGFLVGLVAKFYNRLSVRQAG